MTAVPEAILGPKEKLQVLLAEYNSLRAEAINRGGTAYQLLGIGIAGVAALASIGIWLILPIFAILMGFVSWCVMSDVQNVNDRVCELEGKINANFGETLLVWQTRGGGVFGRLLRSLVGRAKISN
jgi:hypothetical protein